MDLENECSDVFGWLDLPKRSVISVSDPFSSHPGPTSFLTGLPRSSSQNDPVLIAGVESSARRLPQLLSPPALLH
jgi:hypothetical protein